MIKNTLTTYGSVAKSFHWLLALIILTLLGVGLYMVGLPLGLTKLKLYGLHKEFGILILMLACLRLGWRIANVTPILPAHLPWWQKFAAHAIHYAFYFFMFAMPLSGWLMSSASGIPVSFFGLFVLPDLIAPNEQWRGLLVQTHHWLGYALIAAICAHAGAALQHHFIDKDDILRRMVP